MTLLVMLACFYLYIKPDDRYCLLFFFNLCKGQTYLVPCAGRQNVGRQRYTDFHQPPVCGVPVPMPLAPLGASHQASHSLLRKGQRLCCVLC